MKTTVNIPDALLQQAQRLAARDSTTLKALIAEGLRKVVAERTRKPKFVLEDRSVPGEGLQSGADRIDWQEVRGLIYKEHGG